MLHPSSCAWLCVGAIHWWAAGVLSQHAYSPPGHAQRQISYGTGHSQGWSFCVHLFPSLYGASPCICLLFYVCLQFMLLSPSLDQIACVITSVLRRCTWSWSYSTQGPSMNFEFFCFWLAVWLEGTNIWQGEVGCGQNGELDLSWVWKSQQTQSFDMRTCSLPRWRTTSSIFVWLHVLVHYGLAFQESKYCSRNNTYHVTEAPPFSVFPWSDLMYFRRMCACLHMRVFMCASCQVHMACISFFSQSPCICAFDILVGADVRAGGLHLVKEVGLKTKEHLRH